MCFKRFDVVIGAVLGFGPENILRNETLGVECDAVEHNFLELLVTGSVNQMSAVEVFGLIVHDPGGEFLPVRENAEDGFLRRPVQEHLAQARGLTTCAAADDNLIEVGGLARPCACGAGFDAFGAADAAAGVFFNLACLWIELKHSGRSVLAFFCT